MQEEKKENNLTWFEHDYMKFRVMKINNEESIVWSSKNFVNLCFSLVMYDFLNKCEEELKVNIDVDSSWHSHKGFKIKSSEVNLLIVEIINFIIRWEIEINEQGDKFSEEEWYSI